MKRESLHDLHKILISAEKKDETEEKSIEDVFEQDSDLLVKCNEIIMKLTLQLKKLNVIITSTTGVVKRSATEGALLASGELIFL